MAEGRYSGPKHTSADMTGVTTVKKAHREGYRGSYARYNDARYDDGRRFHSRRVADDGWQRTGFWPADVATGVVGGALTTAGAIAATPFSPFLGGSYAYYDSYAYDRPAFGSTYARVGARPCIPPTVSSFPGNPQFCE